jgi:hypothetical protein
MNQGEGCQKPNSGHRVFGQTIQLAVVQLESGGSPLLRLLNDYSLFGCEIDEHGHPILFTVHMQRGVRKNFVSSLCLDHFTDVCTI